MDDLTLWTWKVRCYNKDDKEIDWFFIHDRTEHQASREAEADPRVLAADDWTMIKVQETL